MTSSKPYFVRALYDWIVDNNCTPYLLVDATRTGVVVPQEYVKDGTIVLNIAPGAVVDFNMLDDAVYFNARFSGQPMDVWVPMNSVLGIYAKENGQGMMFDPEPQSPAPSPDNAGPGGSSEKPKKPSLKVVK